MSFALLLVVLLASVTYRNLARPEDGLVLFPFWQNGLVAESAPLWLLGRNYGRPEVYEALADATQRLREQYPGANVAYMDVSTRKGGRMFPHKSHQHGVDVDVRLWGRGLWGQSIPKRPALVTAGYLFKYGENGRCLWQTFDAEYTWTFLDALRTNNSLEVEKIFVEPYIEDWIIEEARGQGASSSAIQWASDKLRYAGDNAADHKDHLHIRFSAP